MKEITNFHSSIYSKFLDHLEVENLLSSNLANHSDQCRHTAGNEHYKLCTCIMREVSKDVLTQRKSQESFSRSGLKKGSK